MQITVYITLGTSSSIQSNLNPTKENNRYIKKTYPRRYYKLFHDIYIHDLTNS